MTNTNLSDAKEKVKNVLKTVDKEIDVYRDTAIRYCGEYASNLCLI